MDNQRVIFFETKSLHYGNGLNVSLQLKNNIHRHWYVRIIKESSSEFKNSESLKVQRNGESYKCPPIPKITIKRDFIPNPKHITNIIKVYTPRSQLVRDDVCVLESFYNDASAVLNELKNKSLVFLTGHWNAKVGKKIKQHGRDNCI